MLNIKPEFVLQRFLAATCLGLSLIVAFANSNLQAATQNATLQTNAADQHTTDATVYSPLTVIRGPPKGT